MRLLLLAAAMLCASCGSGPSPSSTSAPQVIARVGTTAITADAFAVRLKSTLTAVGQAGGPSNNPAMTAQVRASVLRSMLIDTVIAQEAMAAGVAVTDAEVQAQVDADAQTAGGQTQLQTQLASLGGSLAQLRDEIRSSLNEQKLEDVFARQRAVEIEQKLVGGAAFASLATQYSDDSTTAPKGGTLGTVPRTKVQGDDPTYAAAVLALKQGQHTDPPVHDAQGYDIVELDASTPTTLTLRHIIVNAPTPYTVKERPRWFAAAIFESLAQDCSAGQIHIYISNVGDDPCAAAAGTASPGVTPAPTPTP
ncbi:MAG: SurA N-terminal domain-containing protein [Candidatus Dormibacteraeota bacterium]|nr:SurA N-terminal domain-containing protein [Candidatus Dormibacteraeota bacterium]